MKYQELQPIERELAEKQLLSDDIDKITDSLLRLTFHDMEWRWVQNKCINLSSHPSKEVRHTCIQCFGHIARIHGVLDLVVVLPLLMTMKEDAKLSGYVDDAIDDIEMFIDDMSLSH